MRCLAVEPASCPTLTKGVYAFDYGDTAKLAPITMMYTLGHDFMPPGIHAGGLRYHGDSALISQLYHAGEIEAKAYKQNSCFEGALLFARSEGIVPAPESSHAVRAAIDEAVLAKEEGKEKTILFGLSGHGQLDMGAYDAYLSGNLEDFEYPEEKIRAALERLPKVSCSEGEGSDRKPIRCSSFNRLALGRSAEASVSVASAAVLLSNFKGIQR